MGKKKGRGEKARPAPADNLPGASDELSNSSPSGTLVPRSATEFDVKYRRNENLTEEEQDTIISNVKQGGIALGPKTFFKRDSLPALFNMDRQGVLEVMRNAYSGDKVRIGDDAYLSTPETVKELTKRMEQPRSLLQQEKLRQARDNVEDFSNNPMLQKERAIQNDRIGREMPRVKRQLIRDRSTKVSELSGRPLGGDAEVHHLERVADQPERALDTDNMIILKKDEHQDYHHRSGYPPTPDGLREYAEKHRESWDAEIETNGET